MSSKVGRGESVDVNVDGDADGGADGLFNAAHFEHPAWLAGVAAGERLREPSA